MNWLLPARPTPWLVILAAVLCFQAQAQAVATSVSEHADRLAPEDVPMESILSPDSPEPVLPPAMPETTTPQPNAFAVIAPAARQPIGSLSGRIVFMNSGHGWTFDPAAWRLQRPVLLEMNEDYGNLDQLNFFATYCFNAGATVVSLRPLGHQTNEVILDNDDAAVSFSGFWTNSNVTPFWGTAGDVGFRFAPLNASETATATYTPTLPAAGFYPVYTWARHGSDRGDQLYRIRHTGGESQVRIPHYMVGNGWVYLGEYYFNAGSNNLVGSVTVSNLRGTPKGTYVIADAIRFGNGMGTVDKGGGPSGYPKEDENCRYWIQGNLAQGQSTGLYEGSGNDESDSWSAPPKMSAEMNLGPSQPPGGATVLDYKRIHISFHSNAGGGRGTVGLITGDPTPNQSTLAQIAGGEVDGDLVALGSPPLEVPWFDRSTVTFSGGYSEIDGSLFNYEMDATIIEVAYHDDPDDVKLLRDSKARAAVGKAAMHAVVKYFNQFDTNAPPGLNFLPEAPTNVRAIGATNGSIALSWTPPVNSGGSQNPTNYIIYRSTNGYGFGNPIAVGNVTSFTVTNLPAETDYYFRVSASNAGGESMPSEVAGCRSSLTNTSKVLFVNAFDRFDRTTNLRQNTTIQNYGPPDGSGAIERVWPNRVNSFDYVVQHGKAISAHGLPFDYCQNEAIINNQVQLTNYQFVIWACGNESSAEETFNTTEQSRITSFLAGNGRLFVSGANLANDLDRPSGPTTADREFLHHVLRVAYTNDNSANYTVTATGGGIFAGRASGTIDDGSKGIYWVQNPDVIGPYGAGAAIALTYSGSPGGAGVQYNGSLGNGRVVCFGFPFETITSSVRRDQYMADILNFLSGPIATNVPATILTPPQNTLVVQGSNATLTVGATGTPPLFYQWSFNGGILPGATQSSFTRLNAQPIHSGNYQVVVTNAFGSTTSQVGTLTVILPTLQSLFADNFDVNTAANWVTNQSSADTRVTFNYNYAADGIPAAPNSGGTTRGVKFEANIVNSNVAAINISPVGQNFTGNYQLHFDMWINANGPFPGGGVGSTEHVTAGIGTAGNRVQWNGAGADGFWFAIDGEGGSTDTTTTSLPDVAAFSGTAIHAAASGVYAAGTASNSRGNGNAYYAGTFPGGQAAPLLQRNTYPQQSGSLAVGTVGFGWRDVIISRQGNTVEWFINGLKMATITGATFTANNIFIGYWDSYASVSDNAALSFGLIDNVRIERFVTNAPPFITAHPQSRNVLAGTNVTFSVTAGGTAPLNYQWRLNGTNITGANSSLFTLMNVQPADSGNYSVLVTNLVGMVTSSNAALIVTAPQPLKFQLISLEANQVRLILNGEPGSYAVMTSSNLASWDPWTNVVITSGPVEILDQLLTNAQPRFYRAGPQP